VPQQNAYCGPSKLPALKGDQLDDLARGNGEICKGRGSANFMRDPDVYVRCMPES